MPLSRRVSRARRPAHPALRQGRLERKREMYCGEKTASCTGARGDCFNTASGTFRRSVEWVPGCPIYRPLHGVTKHYQTPWFQCLFEQICLLGSNINYILETLISSEKRGKSTIQNIPRVSKKWGPGCKTPYWPSRGMSGATRRMQSAGGSHVPNAKKRLTHKLQVTAELPSLFLTLSNIISGGMEGTKPLITRRSVSVTTPVLCGHVTVASLWCISGIITPLPLDQLQLPVQENNLAVNMQGKVA